MASKRIKGITIEIDGDTRPLTKALKDTDKQLGETQRDLKDIDRLLKLDPKNTELLAQKQKLLAKQTELTKSRLKTLEKASDQMSDAMKDGADATEDQTHSFDALQRELIATKGKLADVEAQANDTGDAIGGMTGKSTGSGTAFAGIGTAALVEAGKAALGYVQDAGELQRMLAKLDTAATEQGRSIEAVRDVWKDFYTVTGQDDSSIEAVSNLMQAGFKDTEMERAMEAISGAVIRFPDTLNIESLADSMQETLLTGEATGQYAELIGRLGINLEDFKAELAGASTEAERQEIVLSALASGGLAETYAGWKQENAAMVDASAASIEIQESLADLNAKMQPLVATVTQFAAKVIGFVSENEWILGVIAAITAAIVTYKGVMIALEAKTQLAAAAQWALNAAQSANPIGLVVTAIAGLIAIFATLWMNCEGFRNFFISMWDGIVTAATNAWNWITDLFAKGGEIFNGVVDGIANVFKTIVNNIISGINWVISQPFDFINGILNSIRNVDVLGFKPFEGLWSQNPLPVPQIPMLAKGGIVTAGSAIVGEAGAELLTVSGGRAIVQPLGGGAASRTAPSAAVNVTINNGSFTQRDAVRIARMVNSELGKVY